MRYITVNNETNIIETILSVTDSLRFDDIITLKDKMKSVGFIENDRYLSYGFSWLKYQGVVDDQIVCLHITNNPKDTSDKNFYLTEKVFRKKISLFALQHRDNDLPAQIRYEIGLEHEKNIHLAYYVCGKESRDNPKDPTIIYKNTETSEYFYNVPQELSNNDFYLRRINIVNETNRINEVVIHYGDFHCNLETLVTALPETANFKIEDFLNLNEILSLEEKQLIQMANT